MRGGLTSEEGLEHIAGLELIEGAFGLAEPHIEAAHIADGFEVNDDLFADGEAVFLRAGVQALPVETDDFVLELAAGHALRVLDADTLDPALSELDVDHEQVLMALVALSVQLVPQPHFVRHLGRVHVRVYERVGHLRPALQETVRQLRLGVALCQGLVSGGLLMLLELSGGAVQRSLRAARHCAHPRCLQEDMGCTGLGENSPSAASGCIG